MKRVAQEPLTWLVGALLGLGIYLRFRDLGFPAHFIFDEHHFVKNARNYLEGLSDWNDHPPLGKLVMAGFMLAFGDTPVGWRAGALATGLLTIVLGGLAAGRLFRRYTAGLVAAALLAADGFLISYSRMGTLDGFLGTCAVGAALLASSPMTTPRFVLAGVLTGVAASIKFTGVAVLAPFCVAGLLTPASHLRRLSWLLLLLGITIGVYACLFMAGLWIAQQPASLTTVAEKTASLIEHHAGLTGMKHTFASGWVTWAIPLRPILLGAVPDFVGVRALSSLGNLAIWWCSVVVGGTVAAKVLWLGLGRVATDPDPDSHSGVTGFVQEHGRAVLILLAGVLGFLAPWIATHRDSYIYHFLPAYVGLILILSGCVAQAYETRWRLAALGFLTLVLLVLAFYAPVWSFMPISDQGLRWRLVFPQWR